MTHLEAHDSLIVFQTSEWKTQIDNETNIAELIKFGETLGYSELEVVDEQYKHTAKEI